VGEFGIVLDYLHNAHALSEPTKHVTHRDSHMAYARSSPLFSWVNRDDVAVVHNCIVRQ
jgi:hypothetical protein